MRLERSSYHDLIVFKGGPSKVQVFIINGIDCSSNLGMQIFFSSSCSLEIEMNNMKCIDGKYESKIFQPVKSHADKRNFFDFKNVYKGLVIILQ